MCKVASAEHNGSYTSLMSPNTPCESEYAMNFAMPQFILLQNLYYNAYQWHHYWKVFLYSQVKTQ